MLHLLTTNFTLSISVAFLHRDPRNRRDGLQLWKTLGSGESSRSETNGEAIINECVVNNAEEEEMATDDPARFISINRGNDSRQIRFRFL